jgi:rfaE bifunctional protein nucleotidyltransferase chain/domain
VVASVDDLLPRIAGIRASGARVVLTNGTFDLLHVGHVRALEEARALGDVLVVGVNSDASVRAYKGPGRPVVPEQERAEIVASLGCVDFVVLFSEPTAEVLIRALRPDIHAKGTDYRKDDVPEAAVVREVGGKVVIVGDPKNHSATDLIRRIRALGREG